MLNPLSVVASAYNCSSRALQRLIDCIKAGRLGVEFSANPFDHPFVLLSFRVAQDFEQARLRPDGQRGQYLPAFDRPILGGYNYE